MNRFVKKYKYVLLISLVVPLASASAESYYVGLQGGWSNLASKNVGNAWSTASQINPTRPDQTVNLSTNGGLTGLNVGMQTKFFQNYLFAAEVDAALNFGSAKFEGSSKGSSKAHGSEGLKYTFGVSFKTGYLFNPDGYVYLRTGAGLGHIKSSTTGDPDVTATPNWTGTTTENDFFYRVGLGVSQQFASNWAVQLEYNYYGFSEFSKEGPFVVNTQVLEQKVKFAPHMSVVLLGVSYVFG